MLARDPHSENEHLFGCNGLSANKAVDQEAVNPSDDDDDDDDDDDVLGSFNSRALRSTLKKETMLK